MNVCVICKHDAVYQVEDLYYCSVKHLNFDFETPEGTTYFITAKTPEGFRKVITMSKASHPYAGVYQ